MVVGSPDYQLGLSKLVYNFRGGISMEYAQDQGYQRIQQLHTHTKNIAEELKDGK